jgi:hypothetical protein
VGWAASAGPDPGTQVSSAIPRSGSIGEIL